MCLAHNKRDEFCYQCVLELGSEQGVMINQYVDRLDRMWETLDGLRGFVREDLLKKFSEIEQAHPVTGIQILAVIPFGCEMNVYFNRGELGKARGELAEVLQQLLNEFSTLRLNDPTVRIGCGVDKFFIYRLG